MIKAGIGFIYSCLLVLHSFSAFGQGDNRITGDFTGVKFEDLVHRMESATDYHFYYDISDLDSFTVTAKANGDHLRDLLQRIFDGTVFHFAIDNQNNIFITKRNIIRTGLPAGFFDRKKSHEEIIDHKEPELRAGEKEKHKLKLSVEKQLFEIGKKTNQPPKGNATLAGYVKDVKNGEALTGVAVYTDDFSKSAITDQFGYYSIALPAGRYTLHISGGGMKETTRQIILHSNGQLNIEMEEFIPSLKAVIVVSERRSNIRGTQMGLEKLSIKKIKEMPALLGEADILRVVLTLPGVVSVGEAATGFNVRGGSTDQNLILLNDATIYNPSHLFGFFSAFNPDVIKSVELYKSAIPEKYGGRLSSVLDVTARDGNNKKFSGSGGIGLLTGKLTLEGPIVKEKSSFIIGGRTTYSDWLLKQLPNSAYRNSRASFFDVDLHMQHTIDAKNNLYLTGYMSNDQFTLNNDTLYKYGNKNINLKWKHIFSNKLYAVITAGLDHYKYAIAGSKNSIKAFETGFDINQKSFRADFSYSAGNKHAINFGTNAIYYKLHPGYYQPSGQQSLVIRDVLAAEQGLESAFYVGDRFTINPKLSVNAGIRYSVFNYLGPRSIYKYTEGFPRDESTVVDTISYKQGKVINTYHGPEFRTAIRYSLSDNSSVKLSFNTLRQYIHMLSNTTAISPTDIWKLSDSNIRPQKGYQVSMGFYRNFKSNLIETSAEVYFKKLENYMDYKSSAVLVMNHHIETDVINTSGRAYGAEFMLKKALGKLNGWISYTWSRTWLKMDDPFAGELINHGDKYPASFDKPHNINMIGNYRFSHRISVSVNIVYSTGRPITLPIAVFDLGGAPRLLYSDRNQYRIPDYFRTDISMNIDGNHNLKKLRHNSWSFGVYNVSGRQNAYSIYFIQQNGKVNGYKLSIFGTPIPFITYNFKF